MDHHSVPCSSSAEERGGGGRRVGTEEHRQQHGQVINKLANAVMTKLANSDPSKTRTPNHMNRIKQCLSGFYPVIRTPDHPTYAVMIQRAVIELNEEGGSTEEAISKFIREQFDCLPLAHGRLLSHHLKKLCESGEIVAASKNCYMLPTEKNDSFPQRERVQKRKGRSERGRGRRSGTGVRHKKLAVQVEVTELREHAQQNQEPNQDLYSELIEDKHGFPVLQNEQVEVKELQSQTQMQDVTMIVEKHNDAKEKYKGQQQIEVTEQGLGQQSSKVIDDQIGSPKEQQDEVNGQRSRKQRQEVDVIVEKQNNLKQKFKEIEEVGMTEQQREHGQQSQEPNQEQCNKVIDNKKGSQEQQNEQPDEVSGQKSQSHMQEVAKTVEEENSAKLKDKVAEEQVEVNEQQRSHGEQSQEPSLQEQHIKVMEDQCGSPDEQKDEVNGQKSENKMQEVAVIVGQQSNSEQKFEANEGQAEVTEHRSEETSLEEQEQYQVVIDRNGSPDKEKDGINGEQSQTQMQEVTVLVGRQRNAEHIYKVTDDEQVEVEQQREDWQQSQEPTQEEQHCKVIDYLSGSPEQQNEQLDEANGQQSRKQMQETAVIFEKQINAEQNYKMTEENIQAREDELIEGQCQTEEQGCSVTREPLQIEGIDREIQLLEEQVEMIEKLATPGQKIELISEPNKPQEEIESIHTIYDSSNLQELLSKKPDKDADIAINSSPSLSSKNWPHHGSTLWSEENCVELLMRTRKLGEKLLDNLSSIRQGSNNSSHKPIKDLEERLVPITSPCGVREDIVCGSPEQQKEKSETSAQREAFVSQPTEMSSSLETPLELFSKDGKLANHGSQQHMPKCQKKSIKTFPDVKLPQQEIGNLERSLELLMMEGENSGEVSGLVGKGACLNFEAKHEEEKHLEVQNADNHADLCSLNKPFISVLVESCQDVSMHSPEHELERKLENQQPKLQKTERPQDVKLQSVEGGHKAQESEPNITNSSFDLFQALQEPDPELPIQEKSQELKQCMQSFGQEKQQQTSLFGGVKASEGQLATDEEQQVESVIKENAVESDLTESKHSCQKQQEKQEQRQQRQLRPRHKKPSESDLQDEEQQAESVINENPFEIELTQNEHSSKKQQEKPEQRQQRQLRHQRQKPSESDCGVPKAPKFQLQENQIEENPVEIETETPDQSCQTQHQALGQQQQRQLRHRGQKSDCGNQKDGEEQQAVKVTEQSCQARHETPEQQQFSGLGPEDQERSNSDLQVENAPVCQEIEHDQQPRERIEEMGVKLEHSAVKMSCQEQQNTKEPTQRRQLRPRGPSQPKFKVSLTTSLVESPPARHQDTLIPNLQEAETPQDAKTGDTQQRRQLRPRVKKLSDSGQDTLKLDLQEAEKPQDLNTSAGKTGKTQQQRQLRPRVKKLSDSGQAPSGSREVLSPSQSLDEDSNSGRSQMQNPGVEDSSQLKAEHENNCNWLKRCTPEPGQNIELPIPEVGPMVGDDLTQAMEPKMNHQGQRKKLKCMPTTTNVPDELVLSSQQLVAEPQVAVMPPQLKPTIKELQQLRHMKLRSHSQCVSQSDPAVSMTESSPSQHQYGQKQEKEHHDELQNPKHQKQNPPRQENVNPTMGVLFPSADGDKQQQKRGRGRPCEKKLVAAATCEESLPDKCRKQLELPEKQTRRRHDVSLPDKCQKQLEQPEKKKRGRPCKLGVKMTVSRFKLTSKNQKQGRGRPRKGD